MKVAAVAVLGVSTLALASDVARLPASQDAEPMVVLYVGADDCGPCRTWRRDRRPSLLAARERRRFEYRELIAPALARALDDEVWPEALRRFRPAPGRVGVPLWLIIREDRVIAQAAGLSGWDKTILPLLHGQPMR